MEIGFLDFGNVLGSHLSMIEHTVEFAQSIDKLGFSRYWLTEHQENGVAWRSPEILMSVLAGYTERIKIGAAGMLLPLNSSLRIAQQFKMLSTLYPNRIDLGIAKGITSSNISNELLNGLDCEHTLLEHDNRVNKLCFFINNEIIKIKQESINIEVPPLSGQIPDVWWLTTSCIDLNPVIYNRTNLSLSLMHFSSIDEQQRIDNLLRFSEKYYSHNKEELNYNVSISIIFSENKNICQKIKENRLNKFMQVNIGGGINECLEYIYKLKEITRAKEIIIMPVYNNFEQKNQLSEALAIEFFKRDVVE